MDETKRQAALKLEERKFNNWVVEAHRTREQKMAATATRTAANGVYQSGGRLKEDLKTTFDAIDEVVTKAVALRKELATKTPELALPINITPLRSRLADFINGGVRFLDHHVKQTMMQAAPQTHSAFSMAAQQEMRVILDRVTNDLENIALEWELMPKEEAKVVVTIQGHGNNVNLGSIIGDLNSSVQILNQSDPNVADAIDKLGKAIEGSASLQDKQKSDSLERLATVSEEIAKPNEKRKLTNLIPALQSLAVLAQTAEHLKPLVVGLMKLLAQHHQIDVSV